MIHRTTIICSCLLLLSVAGFSQNNSSLAGRSARIEKEILRLEELGRVRALKGEKNWDDIMADSAYLIQWDGSVLIYKKGQELPSIPLKSFTLSDLIARVYGDVAIVTGLAKVETETLEKKPFSYEMRYMNVWRKIGNSWKISVAERTSVRPPQK